MTTENAPPPALLDQLIATLLAFFGVPVRFALRVLQGRVIVRRRFAALLRFCKSAHFALRYEGDDDATVQARIDLLAWYAENPRAARKHLARRYRGPRPFLWARFGNVPRPIMRVMGDALVAACNVESPLPDTS